ncbi:MAG: hypothetical protein H7235_09035 [Bdellovibrionaceae bacterium]|nr:hypothetical protein [Pseudobdellovibrionaceae bacterium]
MNKKRVALYLGGVLVMAMVMAVPFYKYSEARTRTMASVAEAQPAAPKKVKEEISVNCDVKESIIKYVSQSSQVVRIKFTDCHHFSKKAPLYAIKNLTNGYDGQVFENQESEVKSRRPASAGRTSPSTQLSTDYIQLQSGENLIELEISLNDGQKLNKKITINRQ